MCDVCVCLSVCVCERCVCVVRTFVRKYADKAKKQGGETTGDFIHGQCPSSRGAGGKHTTSQSIPIMHVKQRTDSQAAESLSLRT